MTPPDEHSPPSTARAAADTDAPSSDAVIAWIVRLASALHRFGVPANRLEPQLAHVSERLGLDGSFFVSPTVIQMAFETPDGTVARFVRVRPGVEDLGKLAQLDAIATGVVRGPLRLEDAARELDEVLAAPPPIRGLLELLAFGVTSAAAGRLLGGGMPETIGGFLGGFGIGLLSRWSANRPSVAPLFEGLAAFLVAIVATTAIALGVPVSFDIAVLAGIIVLLPGLTLTTAATELATQHLIAGAVRAAAAVVSFSALGFGVLLARRIGEATFGPVTAHTPEPLVAWSIPIALVLAPLGFAVILRASTRDFVPILGTAILGTLGARAGALAVGPELGAFGGSLAIGMTSNLLARRRDRPSSVTIVPSILLLVPGSLGFRSFGALMGKDLGASIEAASSMVTVAVALVGGLLVAQAALPARRAL